jgi:hypothetical protein
MGVCLLIAEAKHGPVSGLAAFHQLEHLCTTSARNRTNPMPPVVSAIGTSSQEPHTFERFGQNESPVSCRKVSPLYRSPSLGSQSCRVDL